MDRFLNEGTARTIFSPLPNVVVNGGVITVTGNNVAISGATSRIDGKEYIATYAGSSLVNSGAGKQRYVAWFANKLSQIVKVEGDEGTVAKMPSQPDNTALVGYVTVTDGGVGLPNYDAQFNAKMDKSAKANYSLINSGIDDERYITSFALAQSKYLDYSYSSIKGTTTGGIVNFNLTLPFVTAITGGQFFIVTFNSNSGNNATLNVNGTGNKFLVFQYGAANVTADALTNGSTYQVYYNSYIDKYVVAGMMGPNYFDNRCFVKTSGDQNGDLTMLGILHLKGITRIMKGTEPATATSTGTAGDIRITDDYIYYCRAANTWVRTPLTTW